MNFHHTWVPAVWLVAGLAGCSADPVERTVEVTVGLESDTLSKDPPVARLEILARSVGGDVWKAQASPGGAFDLGEMPADSRIALEVTGFTAQGTVVVRGRSLTIPLEALASDVIYVFAQRVNEWARPPGALARAHAGAPGGVLAERFLVTTGGSSAVGADGKSADTELGDFYDLLTYGGAESPAFSVSARSLVARTSAMFLVSDQAAVWADFASSTVGDVALPAGLTSFAEVAGGAEIPAPEGVSYLVGATRPSGPTQAVLAVAADGTVSFLPLLQARQGAAAVWMDGTGLVVAGGNAAGPGVEVLAPGATSFAARDFPADPTEGAAAVAITGQMTLVGGQLAGAGAPTRTLDPDCVTACTATEIPAASLPQTIVNTSAFSLGSGKAIAIGREIPDPGLMRTFLVDLGASSVTELELREPRWGASVVPAPNGTLAIVGGIHPDGSPALHIEMLFPAP